MTRNWRLIEIAPQQWIWVRENPDGTTSRPEPFATLESCIKDAEKNGFDASMLERRKFQRQPKDLGKDLNE
jgi:hypothetical protein